VIGFGTSAEPGQWRSDRIPYMIEPLNKLLDPGVEEVVFCSSAQVGKTESQLGLVGYHIHHDPAPQLFVLPDEPTCEEISRDRFDPMIEATPVLKHLVSEVRARNADNTKFVKRYPGGRLNFVGAKSPSQLSSKPIRIVQIDELDRCSANCEGDIYSLARTRTTTFRDRKIFLTSTPTLKGTSQIWELYESTEQHKYFLPCPGCEEFQVLEWAQVKWSRMPPRIVWYECPHCQHHWTEPQRLAAVAKGEWRATAEAKPGSEKRRGYWIWTAYSPFVTLDELVSDFLKVRGDKLKLQVFVNTKLGQCWEDPDFEALDWEKLMVRAEGYEPLTVPEPGIVLTAGFDCQKDRIAVVVRAWGVGEESWLVYATELFGDIDGEESWKQLETLLETRFTHACGAELPIDCAMIDSSAFTQRVYNQVRSLQKKFTIYPTKGLSTPNNPIINRPTAQDITVSGKTVIRGGIKLWPIGVHTAKHLFYGRLAETEQSAGRYHWYQVGEDYFQQIVSERLETRYVKGFPKKEWVLKAGVRNEFLDCEILAMAALYSMGCSHKGFWERWKKRLAVVDVVPPEQEVSPVAKRQPKRRELRRGWMKSRG
jgi:terminase, large subunit